MKQHTFKILSTVGMIKSSILTDPHVLCWFTFLVTQPSVRNRLKTNKEIQNQYNLFGKNILSVNILYIILILSLIVAYMTRQNYYLIAASIFLALIWAFNKRRKYYIAQLGQTLISDEIKEFEKNTLFQICEKLSRIHNVLSFTDLLCNIDNMRRRVIMGTFALSFYLIPFSPLEALFFIVISYLTLVTFVQSPIVLKFLK